MNNNKFWELYKINTSTASENVRKLAFAGIAVVWLFKVEAAGELRLAAELICAVVLLSAGLFIDTVHYLYAAMVWRTHAKSLEKIERRGEEVPSGSPKWMSNSIDAIFWAKATLVILGYVCLLIYMVSRLT